MIKAVLFDAGDVIYRRRRDLSGLPAFLSRFGLTPPDLASAELRNLRLVAYAGGITRAQFFDEILTRSGLPEQHRDEGQRVLADAQAAIEYFPGSPQTLRDMKQAGLRLGIVTNTFDSTLTKLGWFRTAAIDGVWDSFATSCELKLVKPNPGIYLTALSSLDLYPQEAAFVGHAEAELEGARRLGLRTVAFNRDHDGVVADRVIETFAELPAAVRSLH